MAREQLGPAPATPVDAATKSYVDSASNAYAATIGNGSATAIAVTHNLGTMDVVVSVHLVSTGEEVDCDVVKTSGNVVTLTFATAPAASSLRCTVLGTAFGNGSPSPTSSLSITDATATGRSLITAADAGEARAAIDAPRKQAVDIRDHIISGTTFDLAAVVAAMEEGNGACFVPPGEWTADAFNIALDETLVTSVNLNLGIAKARFTYKFYGTGKQSMVLLPSGMTTGDYLLVANPLLKTLEDAPTTHPKIVLQDLAFNGVNSPNGGVLKVYERSFSASRLYLGVIRTAFYSAGYCDLVRLDHVYAEAMTAGGWVYESTGNGDGIIIDQLMAYGSGAVKLQTCLGASIRGSLSGWWEFRNSDVTLLDNHIEGDGSETTAPVVTIRNSIVNVLSGYYEAKKYRPFFSVDDSASAYIPSKVIFHEGVRFTQRIDDPGSEYGSARAVDVDIVDLGIRGEVTFKSCKSYAYLVSASKGLGGGDYSMILAPNVTASGVAGIQTALTNNPLRVTADSTIRYVGSGAWEISPTDRKAIPTQSLSAVFAAATVGTSDYVTTTLTAGTYYYKAWMVDAVGRATNPSSEVSATLSSEDPLALLTLSTTKGPARLRIVRGTASGNYTKYAEILVPDKVNYFYDQGTTIAGSTWSNYSGTPAVPTASGTYNETASGMFFYDTGNSQIWKSAAPTAGTWVLGDRCFNTSPASGPPGWVCTVAGTPGTWVATADVSSAQVFTNKDLTSGTNTFPTLNQNTTGSAAKLTTARTINGVAFDGSANVRVWTQDLPRTQLRVATNRASTGAGSNYCLYQRVIGSGTISKIGLWIKVSSGNISVAVYSNSGTGSAAVPTTRQATSGAVSCPASGYAEISLGASVAVNDGDWIAISVDNVTATFASPLTDGGALNDFGKGVQYAQASAHPAPSSAGTLFATVGYDIGLNGVV